MKMPADKEQFMNDIVQWVCNDSLKRVIARMVKEGAFVESMRTGTLTIRVVESMRTGTLTIRVVESMRTGTLTIRVSVDDILPPDVH